METGFTKGEWEIDGNCVYALNNKGTNRFSADVQHGNTDNGDCTHVEELQANARLIAAAPEMYEALKLYQTHQRGTTGHYCWCCKCAIDEALAKAEGKQ